MKKAKLLLSCLLCMTVLLGALSVSVSATRPEEARTLKQVYVNEELDGYEIPYVLYLPANYDEAKEYPVLLLLHGAGERGSDNELQLFHAVDELYETRQALMDDCIFLVPQCPLEEQWVDWPWTNGNYSVDEIPESKALSTVIKLLGEILEQYAADTNRVYIMGISMGGFGTWDALVRHEPIFAAGVPLCGGGDPSKVDILKEIPIWCVHGTVDSAVPFAGTEEMYNTIVAAGGERITFEPMDGMDHNIWDYATTNGALIDWLFAQNLELRYPPAPETEPVTEAVTNPIEPGIETDVLPVEDGSATPIAAAVVIAVLAVGAVVGFVMTRRKK